MNPDGGWEITKITKGDPIDELLESRNYDMKEIYGCYELQFRPGRHRRQTAQTGSHGELGAPVQDHAQLPVFGVAIILSSERRNVILSEAKDLP